MNVRHFMDLPLAASILTITAAFVSLFIGIVGMMESATMSARMRSYVDYLWIFEGVFGIVGFAFGWMGGMLSLERRRFRFSIVGMSVVLLSGFVTMVVFGVAFGLGGVLSGGLLFGLSTIVLSILGLICTTVAKKEFS
jgi:hypothetical protein